MNVISNSQTFQIYTHADGAKYVNSDTTTVEGLELARRLDLVGSGLADVVFSHRLHGVSKIFDGRRRGRVFALFRHPVDRAVSMFYYLRRADWEPTHDRALRGMTLLEFAGSGKAEENWMVRSLTNDFAEELTDQHLAAAKEVLRRKVLVGNLDSFDESIRRFEQYFGWWQGIADDVTKMKCQQALTTKGDNRNEHPKFLPGSREFEALKALNWADVQLYNYAQTLYQEQASLF